MEINLNVANYLFFFLLLFSIILLSIMYLSGTFDKKVDPDLEKIKKYLVNADTLDDKLDKLDRPILWIYNDYKINDRNWESFGSRNTKELNKPIIYITIDTIIKHCGKSFYICLIDNNTFNNLIPNWPHNLDQIPDPVKEHYKFIGIMRLLYLYGGMNIPSSFLCFKNLNQLYVDGIKKNKFFIGESLSNNNESDVFVDKYILGCKKNDETFMEFLEQIEEMLYKDPSDEPMFLDKVNRMYLEGVDSKQINVINGEYLGLYDNKKELIKMEDMLGNNDIEFNKKAYGVDIPIDKIINSLHYEWFSKLNEKEIPETNTLIGKQIRKLYSNDKRIKTNSN